MHRHSSPINLLIAPRQANSFRDIKDNRSEAVFVEEYFLIVWDLTDRAFGLDMLACF